jgi:DNA-binding LacI/PurR family transcriptional regulator
MEAMGAMSAGILLEAITAADQNREFAPVRRKIPAELVVRESTRPLL